MSESHSAEHCLLASTRRILRPARPELAAALVAIIPGVCASHITRVRSEIRSAASLDDEEVLDDLPLVLESMVQLFGEEGGIERFAMLGPAHATARVAQNFSFWDLTNEYLLLRTFLRARLEEQLARQLQPEESEMFETAHQVLVSQTEVSFAVQREARIRLETTAQGHFISSLAHDLRNELQAVLNSLSLLEEAGVGVASPGAGGGSAVAHPQVKELVEEAAASRRTIESTLRSMTRLLEAERLGAGAITTRRREVMLHALLSAIVRGAGDPRVRLECPEDLVLHTDPDLLSTIVSNLVGNAVKYAPEGAIFLRARGPGVDGGRIEVEDEGPGIPEELQARMFEKFSQRAPGSRDGFGLGLFIARRAADLLQARLEVASVAGVRTIFALQLEPQRTDATATRPRPSHE